MSSISLEKEYEECSALELPSRVADVELEVNDFFFRRGDGDKVWERTACAAAIDAAIPLLFGTHNGSGRTVSSTTSSPVSTSLSLFGEAVQPERKLKRQWVVEA